MTTYLESELLLAVQRLKEKFPNLKMTSIIYKGKLVHNQLPFNVIAIIYNIFFSSYECSSKYNKFKNISFKQNFSENSENSSENNQDNKVNIINLKIFLLNKILAKIAKIHPKIIKIIKIKKKRKKRK